MSHTQNHRIRPDKSYTPQVLENIRTLQYILIADSLPPPSLPPSPSVEAHTLHDKQIFEVLFGELFCLFKLILRHFTASQGHFNPKNVSVQYAKKKRLILVGRIPMNKYINKNRSTTPFCFSLFYFFPSKRVGSLLLLGFAYTEATGRVRRKIPQEVRCFKEHLCFEANSMYCSGTTADSVVDSFPHCFFKFFLNYVCLDSSLA